MTTEERALLTEIEIKFDTDLIESKGIFIRAKTRKKAGSKHNMGYVRVYMLGKNYLQHRLVWLWMNGSFPENDIDHINHIKTDNRIENLRDATRKENLRNCKKSNSRSGIRGVIYQEVIKNGKVYRYWRVEIGGVGNRFGKSFPFNQKNKAVACAKSKFKELGYHKNHGALASA